MNIPISNDEEKLVQEKENENNNDIKEQPDKKEIQEKEDTSVNKKSQDELIDEYKEQLQRVQAEFINYRKRVENERKKDFITAKGNLVSSILPVLDDFDRLFEHYQEKKQCNIKEVKMLYDNLKKILCIEKLSEIKDKGCEFDPNCHEAVGVVQTSPENDEMVMEVLQKGYKFGERLLRPSRVKVGKYCEIKNNDTEDRDT